MYGIKEEKNEKDDHQKFLKLVDDTLEVEYNKNYCRSIRRIEKQSKQNVRPLLVECLNNSQRKLFLQKTEELKEQNIYVPPNIPRKIITSENHAIKNRR